LILSVRNLLEVVLLGWMAVRLWRLGSPGAGPGITAQAAPVTGLHRSILKE